ncbi:MAG: HAD family hydrolase [Oscillospiraceae bacterium]|nr:HAD family hydrolase [Oscillospiraceae bacterium]
MNYESLIFDIDGTLWDSRQLVAEGYNIQLEKEGLSHLFVTAEDLQPLFGKVMTEIADTIFASIDPAQRYDLMERCMETENAYLFANECKIGYPKVKETLEALSKKYRLFIVSNSQCGYPELCMDKLGLRDYIEGHMCFGDTGTSKGQTILTLIRKHNIGSCIYIGDTQGDLEACREADIPFIFCAYGLGKAESWDAKIEKIDDLLELKI